MSAQFRRWTNTACNTADLWFGTLNWTFLGAHTDWIAPAQEGHLGLTHKLWSQKSVLQFAKAAGTEKYEALKNIYTVLMAAWDIAEEPTLLSVGGNCVWADSHRFDMGTAWELSREQKQHEEHVWWATAQAHWTVEADNSHTLQAVDPGEPESIEQSLRFLRMDGLRGSVREVVFFL